MFAMAGKYPILCLILVTFLSACTADKPVEPKKPQPPVTIVKPKRPTLTPEQREELGFPPDLISKVELSAGSEAEPFFVSIEVPSENLKGEKGLEQDKLAGFSVRTKQADELISSFRAELRVKGYLIFKSQKSYGSLPDIVTVIKGKNSYDILKIQRTEAPNYRLDTNKIIKWLKEQQQLGTFVLTGAGPDWIEARFIKPPQNMKGFAKKVYAFAPDIRSQGPQTVDKLAERMKKTNGFDLMWD